MKTVAVEVDSNDIDISTLLQEIPTVLLCMEINKRGEPFVGHYYTQSAKESIRNLEYFKAPKEIIDALKKWVNEPFADQGKLEKWLALTK